MRLTGTVVASPDTVIDDGGVVVEQDTITFVGNAAVAREQYPNHEERSFDIIAPGMVNAHIHSVQSLGRGIADDETLLDWLFDHVLPLEAALDREAMGVAATLGYLECLESGVTTVVDHPSVHHTDAVFEAAGQVGIRARLGKVLMDTNAPDGLEEATETGLATTERLIEQYHDSFEGRVTYAVTPRFAVTCSEDCLRGAREIADTYDVMIHTHASENREEIATVEDRTGYSNIEWLHEVGLTGPDVLLAHCVWTTREERDRLESTATNVVHCPSANMKLASGIAPIPEYHARGMTVALGNDGPPCNNTLDPFTEMRQASLLAKVDRLDSTILPAATVFRMATIDGARAAGFDRVGKLEPGWKADLIGMSTASSRATPVTDVISHLVYSAHGDDVEFTMVDGNVVYDGTAQLVEAAHIREQARTVASTLQ